MRRHLWPLIVLAGLLADTAAAEEPARLWHPDYESAAAAAEEMDRPLLIHFHAEWCGPCRRMESEVLNEPSVLDGLRDRVAAVKVNYDERADLVARYKVKALPCDLLVARDGEVLLRTTGYVGVRVYADQVARLARPLPEGGLLSMLSTARRDAGGAQQLGAVRHVGTELLAASNR